MARAKTDSTDTILGRNVRRRRDALGMSQEELARAARLDPAAVSRIELGRAGGTRGVGLRKIERLASALRTTPSQLLQA